MQSYSNLSPLLTTGVFWQALIEAYPEAASIENDHGDLPLHILLQNGGVGNVPSEVATKIFDANPEAIRKTDSLGRYPLHADRE